MSDSEEAIELKKSLAVLALIVFFVALIVYRGYRQKTDRSLVEESGVTKVDIVRPRPYLFKNTVSFTAEIKPENMVALISKVSGRTVLKVYADVGDTVKAGDVLAELDESLVRQDIAGAEAVLSRAEAQYRTAESDYLRMKNLLEEEVISRQSFDHSEAGYKAASGQLNEAKAALAQLRILLGYHRIVSPVSGIVDRRNIDPGDTVSQQVPLFIINQQGNVKVKGAVPESSFFSLEKGQPAVITVDAIPEKKFEGRITRLSPALDPVTRTGQVEVMLPSGGILKPGVFARVTIEIGSSENLAVPRDIVRPLAGTGDFQIFVVSGDRASRRIVGIAKEENNMVQISGDIDLSSGDMVISTLTDKIKDGARIEVTGK